MKIKENLLHGKMNIMILDKNKIKQQLTLPPQNGCKTIKDNTYFITKQGPGISTNEYNNI